MCVVEGGDGESPRALAADTPVGAGFKHTAQSVFAPFGDKLDAVFGGLKGKIAQGFLFALDDAVYADEPLIGGAEDGGCFAAPIVRITVPKEMIVEEASVLSEVFDDFGVGFPDIFALEPCGDGFIVGSVGTNGAVDIESFAQTSLVVFGAVSWGGVDDPRSVGERDVICRNNGACTINERMLVADLGVDEGASFDRTEAGDVGGSAFLEDGFVEGSAEDGVAGVSVLGKAVESVFFVGSDSHGEVGGESPRCGRPDHQVDGGVCWCVKLGWKGVSVGELKEDVDADILAIFVFEFGFGEGGLVGDRPVDGLECAVDESFLNEIREDFEDSAFVGGIHRDVGMCVVAHGSEALHLLGLDFDEFFCVSFAASTDLQGNHLTGFFAEFLGDFVFDGEAVAVPSWDKVDLETGHATGANDEVFENFVEQVSEVDRAVGVGRAVVENKGAVGGWLVSDAREDLDLVPSFLDLRFVLNEVCAHRKAGLRQVEGFFVGVFFFCIFLRHPKNSRV